MRTGPDHARRLDRDLDHAPAPRARARLGRALALVALAACSTSDRPPATCTCEPANATHLKLANEEVTPSSLLAHLRKHAALVAAKRPGRDVKMFDDELRSAIVHYCSPCGAWIDDRATIESLYPFDRLDDATSATCLGLLLRDSTIAWGEARPPACRR